MWGQHRARHPPSLLVQHHRTVMVRALFPHTQSSCEQNVQGWPSWDCDPDWSQLAAVRTVQGLSKAMQRRTKVPGAGTRFLVQAINP